MGANAVTTVPVYVAGEVLTAADLNITNSGIPVFATTVERDAAFGGTGEKTLAEGQFAYLETGNVTQYYDGAGWQSVGVSPGLVLVGSASPSAAGTVSIDNCFTSTYDNYLVVSRLSRTNAGNINLRYRVGGVDATGANYNNQAVQAGANSASAGAAFSTGQTSAVAIGDSGGVDNNSASITITSPALATPTNAMSTNSYLNGTVIAITGSYHSLSTAYDGITFFPAAGTITGTIRVYGYANS
jgi:hypothetical protein